MLSYADMTPSGRRYFDEIEVGEEFESPGRTVTETDIVLFAGLSGDYNVLHTDAEFMKKSIFGERIAHGLLGLAIQSGLFYRTGRVFATLAFVGLKWKFKGPIRSATRSGCARGLRASARPGRPIAAWSSSSA